MEFSLSQDQKALQASIIKFAQGALNEDVHERDQAGEFRRDLWEQCGQMGLLGLPVDEDLGGTGLDALSSVLALEALGYGCKDSGLTFSVCAHLLACVVPIWKHGSDEMKQKYLPQLCSGSMIAVNAMTEPSTGSDPFAMRAVAVQEGDQYRLNGNKTFSSNGPVADLAVFYAMTDKEKGYNGGTSAFLVEREAHGFESGQRFSKMGLRTSPIGELVFDDVLVPKENVLGQEGGGGRIFAESMEWERICLVACHLGVMQRLLESSISYARERKQFDQPISKFQSVSNRIVDMKVRLEASKLLVYQAAWSLDHRRSLAMDASITKLFVSEALLQSAQDAVRTLGGYGFMVEYDAERAVRDAMGGVLYSGTNDMQRNIIASWLGL